MPTQMNSAAMMMPWLTIWMIAPLRPSTLREKIPSTMKPNSLSEA